MAQSKSGGGGGGPSSRPPIDDKNRQQLMFSIAVTIGGAIAAGYVLTGGSAVEITYKEFINDYLSAGQVGYVMGYFCKSVCISVHMLEFHDACMVNN